MQATDPARWDAPELTTVMAAIKAAALALMRPGDPSHDGAHLARVVAQCHTLGRAEGANPRVLLAAAWLHDLVNLPKNHPDRAQASAASADAARRLLAEQGYAEDEIAQVVRAIEEHSYSRGLPCTSVESRVLQDADRLDALGAVGLLRVSTCGTLMGSSYYDPADPWALQRELNDKAFVLDHFPAKLLKLVGLFNTRSGREEAERRTRFMRDFVSQLRSELGAPGDASTGAWRAEHWTPTTAPSIPSRPRALQTLRGSCHCGAVRFEIRTDFPELTQCDCSICKRKNALMVKVHERDFQLLAGEDALTEYQFHTHTARHFFCKVCGIYPFHRKRVTPDHLGINVHCLEDFDPAGIPVRQAVGAAMR